MGKKSTPSGKERRNYVRMDDNIILDFVVLDKQSKNNKFKREAQAYELFEALDKEMKSIDIANNKLLAEVSARDAFIAEYFRVLNEKINLLSNFLSTGILAKLLLNADQKATSKVNLSAGGLAFIHDKHIPMGTRLKFKFILLPTYECIIADGHVVTCIDVEDDHYKLAIQFDELSDLDEQKIVRHIQHNQIAKRHARTK